MKNIETAGEYMRFEGTRHQSGPEFYIDGEKLIFSCELPQPENDEMCSMSFCLFANSLEEFMANFSVNDVRRMKQNRVEKLWLMFFDGRLELYCRVELEKDHFLFFSKERGLMEASENSKEWFEVEELLEKEEDFVRYTREYYEGLE
jgi:hypothetical protein